MIKSNRPEWLSGVESTIAETVAKHERVALLYSGGIESSLLLHLAVPWRDKITLYTVRTGAEFPHMVDFVDRKLSGWDHRVVRVDLGASFAELGIPASAVPIENMKGIGGMLNINERLPHIVPWPLCCVRNRWQPGCEAIKADGLSIAIHGQRAGDYPKSIPTTLEYPGLELVSPLWSASRAEVLAAVTTLGIELPEHYGEYPSSLDCAVCPSSLTSKRRAWMAKRYPDVLTVAEGLQTVATV
jgi:3'-phosphoadenosine 5'-phosphosulfate sulfotransferase (PAPS reductase)/FAD synthetase